MKTLALARVSYQDDFLISFHVYMMTGSFHMSLCEGTPHVNKIHLWFKIANITHALPIPVYRQMCGRFAFTWYLSEISYQSDILAPVQQLKWTHPRGAWLRHGIWWWYQVNKCRTRRGNRSELAPVRKSPRCHVNTPLRWGETRATPDWKECLKYLVECTTRLELALTLKIRKRLTIKCMQLQIYYCAHSWNIFNTWKEISHLR